MIRSDSILRRRPGKFLALLVISNGLALVYLLKANMQYRQENAEFTKSIEQRPALTAQTNRISLLEREHQKLKASLEEIPKLIAQKQRLELELAANQAIDTNSIASLSNRIQQATERNWREMREIDAWMRQRSEDEVRIKALERLQEKGLPQSQTPEQVQQEYETARARLQQIGLVIKKRVELRQEWQRSDKSEATRAQFGPRLEQAFEAVQDSLKSLGKDRILYRELPVIIPLQKPHERTPVLQSIVPDLRGVSTTVYLDGSVVFSR